MKPSRLIFTILTVIFSLTIYGQEGQELKKEIGISFFVIEFNSETLNIQLDPKFVYGVSFNRYYSNWSWINNLEFGKNVINDECRQCSDTYYGKGNMTELIASSGLRYTFYKRKSCIIKPIIESDLYYSYIRYTGDFQGGFFGQGRQLDNSYNILGISGRVGLSFYPVQKISLTVSSSIRFGGGKIRDHYEEHTDASFSLAATVLHFRLGYLF
jgi:hypothetical protein